MLEMNLMIFFTVFISSLPPFRLHETSIPPSSTNVIPLPSNHEDPLLIAAKEVSRLEQDLNCCHSSKGNFTQESARPNETAMKISQCPLDDMKLTYVSVCLKLTSILFLVLHLVAFGIAPSLHTLFGACTASLSVAILVSHALQVSYKISKSAPCLQLTFTQYFFVCSYFWMNVISYDVCRILRLARRLERMPDRELQCNRFLVYSLYAWLAPVAAIGGAYVVDIFASNKESPFGRRKSPFADDCWIFDFLSVCIVVTLLSAIVIVDFAFYVTCTWMIQRSSRGMIAEKSGRKFCRLFSVQLRLAVVMGLSSVAFIVQSFARTPVVSYACECLLSINGFFIFLCFTCRTKVMNQVIEKIICCPEKSDRNK